MTGNQWMRPMRAMGIATGMAALAGGCVPAPTSDATMPGFMTGTWRQGVGKGEDGDWAEEFWTFARAGQMMGSGRTGRGAALNSWEHMRIERGSKGEVSFFAMPEGGRENEFPMVDSTRTSITFANPAHDYPQRIRYWREGGNLKAEIARVDGSKAVIWTFKSVRR